MDIEFLGHKSKHNPSGGLCDEYQLNNIENIEDLLLFIRDKKQQYPDKKLLLSLDDFSQACYTSGHARNTYHLDEVGSLDLSSVSPEAFEDGEHQGYLSTPSEFFICQHNFNQLVKDAIFSDACNKGLTLSEEYIDEWEDYQKSPLSMFDQPLSALLVPVNHAYQTLSAFPNGYFSSDLSPAENFAVAKRLEERYGLELIGVGASYLGFIRNQPLSHQQIYAMSEDLLCLYNIADKDKQAYLEIFSRWLAEGEFFWLRYVE